MFDSIKATNFYSWKELEFNFQEGITIVDGFNHDDGRSEGSGKSSIFEALTWCLFGQCSRDVNIDDVIRLGEKHCSVEVKLKDNISIVRSRNPNQLYIKRNGSMEIGKDVKETQKLINGIIGMSFDTFCNCIYSPQSYTNKFITASQENKAKILSEIQDLSVFDKASKKAFELLKQNGSMLSDLQLSYRNKQNILGIYQSEFETFCKLSDNFDSDKLEQLDSILLQSEQIEKQYKTIEEQVKSIKIEDHTVYHNKLVELNHDIRNHQIKLAQIEELKRCKSEAELNKICPTCKQNIIKNNDLIEIPDNTSLLNALETLQTEYQEVSSKAQAIVDSGVNKKVLNGKLEGYREQLTLLSQQVSRIESTNNPYLDKIKELHLKNRKLEEELVKLDKEINEKNKKVSNLEFLKNGYKEIKSFVFQSLLTELNNKANKYLRELFEVSVNITFHNISEEGEISKIQTLVTLYGQERSLGLLSGGQFRRVQLAVDFALSDVVSERSNNPINLRILDEVCKDLSEESMYKVIDILKNMNGCVVVIEHNSLIKNIVTNQFNVEYRNGVSYAIDKKAEI